MKTKIHQHYTTFLGDSFGTVPTKDLEIFTCHFWDDVVNITHDSIKLEVKGRYTVYVIKGKDFEDAIRKLDIDRFNKNVNELNK